MEVKKFRRRQPFTVVRSVRADRDAKVGPMPCDRRTGLSRIGFSGHGTPFPRILRMTTIIDFATENK